VSLSSLLDPTLLLLVALGLGLLRARRILGGGLRARRALRAAWIAWIATWLLATQIVVDTAARVLEWPEVDAAAEARARGPDKLALVVLGAGVKTDAPSVPAGETLNQGGTARILGAARLYREIRPRLVVLSGGGAVEAAAALDAAVRAGIPRDRVVSEPRSANTRENAIESVAITRRAHLDIVLVTSALHMRRSVIEFGRRGVRVIAAPVDYVSVRDHNSRSWLPSSTGLLKCAQVAHELYGLVGTWLR
jgi:uncharacterized SAM-binding protein YcdF (DUF218 family)